MQITLEIDDILLSDAMRRTESGVTHTQLIHKCLQDFIRRKAIEHLIAVGGTMPDMADIPRHRGESTE